MVKKIIAALDEVFESIFGLVLFILFVWFLVWLYLEATPDSVNGDGDDEAALEEAGLNFKPCY